MPEDIVIDGVDADAVVDGMPVDRDTDVVSVTKASHEMGSTSSSLTHAHKLRINIGYTISITFQ